MADRAAIKQQIMSRIAAAPYPVRQGLLGMGYLLVPRRLPGLLPLVRTTLRDLPKISSGLLPGPEQALANPDGLCGLAGRIGVPDLLAGYAEGMFVMSHFGPLKWWRPCRRMVLFFDQARVEKTVKRLLRNKRFTVTFDRVFAEVVRACATPREGGTPLTWITPRIRTLFTKAHAAGHAHSVEVWEGDTLVGGAYGLAVGKVFYTESQFHNVRDASKVGFAVLNRHLQAWGFALNDGKHPTRYLADCGMVALSREEFEAINRVQARSEGRVGPWQVEESLAGDGWSPATDPGIGMADLLPGGPAEKLGIDELLGERRSPTW